MEVLKEMCRRRYLFSFRYRSRDHTAASDGLTAMKCRGNQAREVSLPNKLLAHLLL